MKAVILALAAALSLVGSFGQTARAEPPETQTFQIDSSQAFADCGFPVVRRDEGTLLYRVHVRRGGAVVVESVRLTNWTITFVDPENGAEATALRAFTERLVQQADGSSTLVSAGLVGMLVIPGEGTVATNVGLLSVAFAADGSVESIAVAGPHDGRLQQFVCPYLGGS